MNTVVMHPSGASHVFGAVMQYPDTWQPDVCFICTGAVLPPGQPGWWQGSWQVCSRLVVSIFTLITCI